MDSLNFTQAICKFISHVLTVTTNAFPTKWIFALHQESSHPAPCLAFHPPSVLSAPIRVQNLFHRNQHEQEEICDWVSSATRAFLTGHLHCSALDFRPRGPPDRFGIRLRRNLGLLPEHGNNKGAFSLCVVKERKKKSMGCVRNRIII